MSLLKHLPKGRVMARQPVWYEHDAPSAALEEWTDRIYAAADSDDTTVNIYEPIGEDWFGDGFSASKMSGILRKIGPKDILVNINSPGGSVFDGLAIYDQLREHPAKVTVRVRGIAASAASVIAMAGDEIHMATGSMMMVHKAWGGIIGNADDFAEAVTVFGQIDKSLASVYAARTGLSDEKIMAMLAGPNRRSDGTWMTAGEAVEMKFADAEFTDETDPAASIPQEKRESIMARRRIETSMAKAGLSRKERADTFAKLDMTPRDASHNSVTNDAFEKLLATMRS
ncbi:head maturation protease, ClpP-related [Ensifer aridi]|uniref:head maturation protease, ClpP-related n=1 Tax=Ensifer aridi TaxID=1708715 RepID=UPI000A11B740|nr:head maturation protease, ClpP-related [Ensifer aridi]